MSKLTNHTGKPQIAGYGLHYYANNQLIPNATDRVLFQSLIDIVRKQLTNSIDDQTIITPLAQLSRIVGLERSRTIPSSLNRLEELGLIRKYKNGILVNCDEYVTLVQHYESLDKQEKFDFASQFQQEGVSVLEKTGISVKIRNRSELVNLAGSSISINDSDVRKNTQISDADAENCVIIRNEVRKNTQFQDSEEQMCVLLRSIPEDLLSTDYAENCAEIRRLAQTIAKIAHNCAPYCDFQKFSSCLDGVFLRTDVKKEIEHAFLTGYFQESFINSLENVRNNAQVGCVFLRTLASKCAYFYATVIIYIINKNINEATNNKNDGLDGKLEEDSFRNIQKGFEGFGKVEVLDLDKPSEDIEEGFIEVDELSQQTIKRAERNLREKNSYRNKPFIKIERIKEIVECLDEVVQSPVEFFLYQFWWGVFDLYCEHYHPSSRINEEGEVEDEPQSCDWQEMIGAALPQDEIYALAQNVYEDMVGAIEQGVYIYGDNNEWEVNFGFTTFQDFNPYEIFQWSPCTMQDKSVPALRVAMDKFYDIEAGDVFTSSKGDKKTKNAQNKKLIGLIIAAERSQLTPIEAAIQAFYDAFVVVGDESLIDEFTDGKGTTLESGGGLPDHLLKPWCYDLPDVGYNDCTSVLNGRYKPCEGIHKKAYIFSAERVVEWNERNGYTDTIAHKSL